MSEQLETRIMKLVAHHAQTEVAALSLDTKISQTGIDSLGVAELMFDVEDQFDVSLGNAEEIQKRFDLGTIRDMVSLLEQEAQQEAQNV